jgi:predicted Zn-dependent protease
MGPGIGYGATSDLSPAGLKTAAERAAAWAALHGRLGLFDARIHPIHALHAEYRTPIESPWSALSVDAKLALLQDANRALAIDARIVDWSAWLSFRRISQLLVTSAGGRVSQRLESVHPGLLAVANAGTQTQQRHGGGADWAQQGGLERVAAVQLLDEAPRVASEAIALLDAPECPSARCDLVLSPSQMVLQIHESIGHPLELDRILGDERNYAGTSFVTPEMFGCYRYGSEWLNVTFDPTVPMELVSCVADDEGTPARREYLIRRGILERPLGGALSQARAGLPGTACARASSWDRPPIDRMGNINLEPGEGSLMDLIGRVERGVWMDTNRSWSIDDSRNKFQFGCEVGRLIEDWCATRAIEASRRAFGAASMASGGPRRGRCEGSAIAGRVNRISPSLSAMPHPHASSVMSMCSGVARERGRLRQPVGSAFRSAARRRDPVREPVAGGVRLRSDQSQPRPPGRACGSLHAGADPHRGRTAGRGRL